MECGLQALNVASGEALGGVGCMAFWQDMWPSGMMLEFHLNLADYMPDFDLNS